MTYREWLKDRAHEHIDPCRAYNSGYNIAVKYMATLIEPLKADSYEKGKQAERERIRARVVELGKNWILDTTIQQYTNLLLEDQ